MKRFSERIGVKPIKKIQLESMDMELRSRLWNELKMTYWSRIEEGSYGHSDYAVSPYRNFLENLWQNQVKRPLDETRNLYWPDTYSLLMKTFFNAEWYEVYDFIEFMANNYPYRRVNEHFMKSCNLILESEVSAYRFVGGMITPITSKEEISEVEKALAAAPSPAQTHLTTALRLLSDKRDPDYRNSIKESISAVESVCRAISGKEKATLGDCLGKIEGKIPIHKALRNAFSALYGYTSNAEGIRHGLMDEPKLGSEDAMFMLISCSAFINYLLVKASSAGIKL